MISLNSIPLHVLQLVFLLDIYKFYLIVAHDFAEKRIGLGTIALSILEKHRSILNKYLPAQKSAQQKQKNYSKKLNPVLGLMYNPFCR